MSDEGIIQVKSKQETVDPALELLSQCRIVKPLLYTAQGLFSTDLKQSIDFQLPSWKPFYDRYLQYLTELSIQIHKDHQSLVQSMHSLEKSSSLLYNSVNAKQATLNNSLNRIESQQKSISQALKESRNAFKSIFQLLEKVELFIPKVEHLDDKYPHLSQIKKSLD